MPGPVCITSVVIIDVSRIIGNPVKPVIVYSKSPQPAYTTVPVIIDVDSPGTNYSSVVIVINRNAFNLNYRTIIVILNIRLVIIARVITNIHIGRRNIYHVGSLKFGIVIKIELPIWINGKLNSAFYKYDCVFIVISRVYIRSFYQV